MQCLYPGWGGAPLPPKPPLGQGGFARLEPPLLTSLIPLLHYYSWSCNFSNDKLTLWITDYVSVQINKNHVTSGTAFVKPRSFVNIWKLYPRQSINIAANWQLLLSDISGLRVIIITSYIHHCVVRIITYP